MRSLALIITALAVLLSALCMFPAGVAAVADPSEKEPLNIGDYPELGGLGKDEPAALFFLRYGNERSEKALESAMGVKTVRLIVLDADIERNYVLLQRLLEHYSVDVEDMLLPIVFFDTGFISGYDSVGQGFSELMAGGGRKGLPIEAIFGPQPDAVPLWAWGAVAVLGVAAGITPIVRFRKMRAKR